MPDKIDAALCSQCWQDSGARDTLVVDVVSYEPAQLFFQIATAINANVNVRCLPQRAGLRIISVVSDTSFVLCNARANKAAGYISC